MTKKRTTDIPESEMRLIRNQAVRYAVDLVTSPHMSFSLSSIGIVKMAEFYAQYIATGKIPESKATQGEDQILEALKWYEDESNYAMRGIEKDFQGTGHAYIKPTAPAPISLDKGQKARDALGQPWIETQGGGES